MSLLRDGIDPLAYLGVKPSAPSNFMLKQTDPTPNDLPNINVGTWWLNYSAEKLWFLISAVGGVATWVQIYPAGGGGGGASQFVTDDGTANEAAGILNILGDGNIITHGSGNTVRLTVSDSFVKNFDTDDGVAHPSSNTIRIIGGTNINTSGASDAVTVNLDNSVTLTGTLQVDGAATFGGTTTFNGNVVIPGQTDGVLQTNGAGTVTATNGTNGQLLIGGGTAPVWANLTSTGGTVIITNGANSINLESTGGGGSGSLSFNYAVTTNVPLSAGGHPDRLGAGNPLSMLYDNTSGAFFPGDLSGNPASFTAPVTGVYQFTFSLALGSIAADNTQLNVYAILNGANLSQFFYSINPYPISYTPTSTHILQLGGTINQKLSSGDVLTFGVTVTGSTGIVIAGTLTFPTTVTTTISGFRVE